MSDTIEITRDAAVARIALNRPDKLNSFTREMHAALRAALDVCESDDSIRAVVLTGNGRGFCAGQDLAELSFEPGKMTDVGALVQDEFNPLVRRLQALPKPVIGRVRGVAAGAGANLALACDLVIASRNASFLQAFVHIGLAPDSGGTFFLPHRVGVARAMGLAMLGEKISGEQAAHWGLIWRCVDDEALDTEVDALARRVAAMPTRALAAIKRAIHAAATNGLSAQLDLERDLQSELCTGHDYAEGVNAFLQKRPAKFEGR
jgi:2-(1,2-epoxy-1,2-dihydrophenyl)acetyl-CoA isomerase